MIFNNSKYLLLAMALVLGGCSSLPSLPSFSSDEAETKTTVNERLDETDVADGDVAIEPTLPVFTPAELEEQALAQKVLGLMGTMNAFKLDKEQQTKLNSSQSQNVKNAMESFSNGEFDKALVELQVLIDDPDFIAAPNTSVWVLRGDIHRVKGDKKKAIIDYQQALELAESNYQAHNRLGLIYRDQGNFDLAKVHYSKAIDAWPGNAASYRNRGILFDLYLGEKLAAVEDYKIYKALIDFQIKSVETPARSLVRQQKLAGQWILDIKRQIKVLEREKANG
jgi:tetratricopeptide (TPR) repeat protein